MKKFNITIILVLFSYILNAQKEGNIWYFGDYAGLDFNSSPPIVLTNGAIHTNEGCSSISDSAGNLLFYTDGSTVWNNNHMPMLKGTGLTGNTTSSQSAIIIKQPGKKNIYYIFSLYNNYCYSVVDMTLNGGLGDITAAKNVMIMGGVDIEKQCATRHANGIDVWIMLHVANSFYAFLLTASGFNPVPVQSTIGLTDNLNLGQMKFSPQGNKIVFGKYGGSQVICLCDFDRSTGIVSNNIDIPNWNAQSYGVEFSPDGSKLYATGNPVAVRKIYQYDLNAGSPAAIIASQIQVGSNLLGDVTGLQTGPDKKIYICLTSSHFLAVINNPDSMGLACNYADSAINLGTGMCQFGLPEFISDYYAYSPLGLRSLDSKNYFSFFPNPAKDYFYIQNDNFRKCFSVILYDIAGRKILETLVTSSVQKINTSQLSNAIYLLEMNIDGERTVKKIAKE